MKKLGAFFIKKDEDEDDDDIKVGSLFASKGKKEITATAMATTPPTGLSSLAHCFALWPPSGLRMSIANQRLHANTPPQPENKTCGHAVVENNSEVL